MRFRSIALAAAAVGALLVAPPPPAAQAAGACGPMDVAIVIDNSISIMDVLPYLRQDAGTIAADVAALSGGDYRMGLVNFRNQLITVRSPLAPGNQNAIAAQLGNLWQESGYGQAHASDEALNTVLNTLPARPNQTDGFTVPWRDNATKTVVLVTNAPPGGFTGVWDEPRDLPIAHQRALDAAERGIRINSVYVATASLHSVASQQVLTDYATTTGGTFTQAMGNGLDIVDHVRAALAACASTEVSIRDDPADTGAEPNPAPIAWTSPDIAVCPTATPCQGGNPAVGTGAYVHVQLNNLGAKPGVGTVEVYYADQGGAAHWPASWRLIGKAVGVTAGTGTATVAVPWDKVPAPGTFGLLARWVSASDPMTFAEDPDTAQNARNNNNIAWRSVTAVEERTLMQHYTLRDTMARLLNTGVRITRAPRGTVVDLGPELGARWRESGSGGSGIERFGEHSVVITDEKEATITGLPLKPDEEIEFVLTFQKDFLRAGTVTRVSQIDEKGTDLGGTEFRAAERTRKQGARRVSS